MSKRNSVEATRLDAAGDEAAAASADTIKRQDRAGNRERSFSAAVQWSIDRVTQKSWLRRALPVMALLVAFNILMNAAQSWHDFRAADVRAAQRLDVQTTLIAGRIADQLRNVHAITTVAGNLREMGTLADTALAGLADAFQGPSGDTLIAVFDPSDGRLIAGSRPGLVNELPPVGQFVAQVRANPSAAVMRPVPWGERGALVVVRAHQDRAGKLDAIVVMVVTFGQPLLAGVNTAPGTAMLLRDGGNRIVMSHPMPQKLAAGEVLADHGKVSAGPTNTTQFAHLAIDDIDRLVSTRKIFPGMTTGYWRLDVGYAVKDYRGNFWTSFYINLSAATVMLVMLAGGMLLIRRERVLHDRVERFASMVSTVVENMPTPVAVVDLATERILLANDALLGEFGALAGAGQAFARLFVDPADWPAVRDTRMDDAIAMLTREGTRHMLVHCTHLEPMGRSATSGTLLVTLVDITRQQQLLKQLRTEADFDALTGLANRRYFERAARTAVAHVAKAGTPLSVLALDLDFFKKVNDSYGHAAGDRVLQVVARLIEGALRESDLAARLGGEEFAALLLDTPVEQAVAVAGRIRVTVENTPIVLESGQAIAQTLSIGIAAYAQMEGEIGSALERADLALYRAKKDGRNRARIFVPEEDSPAAEGSAPGRSGHRDAPAQHN